MALIRQNGSDDRDLDEDHREFETWNQMTARIAQPTDGKLLRMMRIRSLDDRHRRGGSGAPAIARAKPSAMAMSDRGDDPEER